MKKNKRSSSSSKRAKAYVQGRDRKKPVRIYVREKKTREKKRERMYTNTMGVEDGREN